MQPIAYHAPGTVAEAVALMRADPARCRYLAGGTDLYLDLEHRLRDVRAVIDLKGIAALDGIAVAPDGSCRIGALTRMADIEAHPHLRAHAPSLCAAAAVVGGPPIRNRATLGGNVCNASPAADTSTPLLALSAQVTVSDGRKERTLPLARLWSAPRRVTLAPGELVTAVLLPAPAPRTGNAFQRMTRSAMDIAVVNAAAQVGLDAAGNVATATVALGAVGPTVLLVPALAKALAGRPLDDAALATVRVQAESAARPIDDVRASAVYRGEIAGVLAARAVRDAAAHAREGAAAKGGRT